MLNFFSNFWGLYDFLMEIIAWTSLIISFLTVLTYYFYFFIRLRSFKSDTVPFAKPISIIICAKNELSNLRKILPSILSQNYFNFEVVVVNDQSTDDSAAFL